MKSTLFIALISLLITNVVAYGSDGYDYDNHKDMPKTCEELYKVDTCSDCQKAVWDAWDKPGDCAFDIHFFKKIIGKYVDAAKKSTLEPFDLGPFKDSVKEICDEKYECKYEDAEKAWKSVEEKCSKELHTEVDWSKNPKDLDFTVVGAYGTVLIYYFGIPDQKATCVKGSDGEYCSITVTEDFIKYVKEKVPDGKFTVSFDHKYIYKFSDGSRIEIPKDLFSCSDCAKKMVDQFKGWNKDHQLPDYIVKNVFGSWDELEDFYTCHHDSYKMKLRRALNGPSRRQGGTKGFSHYMASTRYLF